jgi:hypothetical protein
MVVHDDPRMSTRWPSLPILTGPFSLEHLTLCSSQFLWSARHGCYAMVAGDDSSAVDENAFLADAHEANSLVHCHLLPCRGVGIRALLRPLTRRQDADVRARALLKRMRLRRTMSHEVTGP